VGERTAFLNQLQQLVFLIFPEFKKVLKDMKGKTAQHILKRTSFNLNTFHHSANVTWFRTLFSH
jgi:hypothetical protein